MIEEIFRQTIRNYGLLKKRDNVILGVSGGPDSVCMLKLFSLIKKEWRLNIVCAHFNHGLRDEADGDEEFVRDICSREKIKFISQKKNVKSFYRGNSLEQTARDARMNFFSETCRRYKIKKIAVAHNRDDAVETVLMRVIRGASLKGLRGIMPKTKFTDFTVIRPLILISKEDILCWLGSNNKPFRVD